MEHGTVPDTQVQYYSAVKGAVITQQQDLLSRYRGLVTLRCYNTLTHCVSRTPADTAALRRCSLHYWFTLFWKAMLGTLAVGAPMLAGLAAPIKPGLSHPVGAWSSGCAAVGPSSGPHSPILLSSLLSAPPATPAIGRGRCARCPRAPHSGGSGKPCACRQPLKPPPAVSEEHLHLQDGLRRVTCRAGAPPCRGHGCGPGKHGPPTRTLYRFGSSSTCPAILPAAGAARHISHTASQARRCAQQLSRRPT